GIGRTLGTHGMGHFLRVWTTCTTRGNGNGRWLPRRCPRDAHGPRRAGMTRRTGSHPPTARRAEREPERGLSWILAGTQRGQHLLTSPQPGEDRFYLPQAELEHQALVGPPGLHVLHLGAQARQPLVAGLLLP